MSKTSQQSPARCGVAARLPVAAVAPGSPACRRLCAGPNRLCAGPNSAGHFPCCGRHYESGPAVWAYPISPPEALRLAVVGLLDSGASGVVCASTSVARRRLACLGAYTAQQLAFLEGFVAMRLTADMIARSPAFLNPLKDREIDLRGAELCYM
eukprot:6200919-Pleurochrysis_carterae.AAC.3